MRETEDQIRGRLFEPGMPRAELDTLVQAERRRQIDADPGVQRLIARMTPEQRARHTEARERQEKQEAMLAEMHQSRDKRAARQAFIEAGGDAAAFETEWPRLRGDIAADHARERVAKLRQAEAARARRILAG